MAFEVDWFKLISSLEKKGVTLRSQGHHAQVSHATVHAWKSGVEPRYWGGSRLIDLYICKFQREPPLRTTNRST